MPFHTPGPIAAIACAVAVLAPTLAQGQPVGAPSMEDAANATITGIYDRAVRLQDGLFEGQPFVEGGQQRPRIRMADSLSLTGDFDDDGRPDRVVFLTENSGGTGRFLYLAVLTATDLGVENTATVAIGDREHPYDLTFDADDGALVVDMIGHGPGDADCCATWDVEMRIVLADGELVSRESEMRGPALPGMLDGTNWRLDRFDWNAPPLDDDIEITLAFDEGRISGHAACNRYFAMILDDGDTTRLSLPLDAIGVTRMACPDPQMSAEDAYLDRLAGLHTFSFDFGNLVLLYTLDGDGGALVFEPVD